jgi:hypothetical protein
VLLEDGVEGTFPLRVVLLLFRVRSGGGGGLAVEAFGSSSRHWEDRKEGELCVLLTVRVSVLTCLRG